MGNSLPLPCVCCYCCHDELEGTAVAGASAKKRRRKLLLQRPDCIRNVRAARGRGTLVVPVVDDVPPEDGDGGRDRAQEQEVWPECRVEPAGHGDNGGVRVRIVMKRKDIAQLVARLEQRGGAEERNADAGMEEVVVGTELAGGNSNDGGRGGGVTMMSPCRDAWRPRLSIIPENY